ncbi:DUF4255 domain-containing protein [Paraburkholderia sp. D15]|uniref:DUF4255 domain-containing protein n=1 Tax=Paraburkholderia sp. D15 TaxID=2880218 RepID=UPI0024785A54|nr:DUF4255 domain-containing protein [Paraburkholderia sp. D15]WGS53948.1 DUF4255 domain-containing protein [Paraburkholderia sp. D15]WKF60516.1 hypothetical protein HUO10_005037 [Paraburkholderia busanensis]
MSTPFSPPYTIVDVNTALNDALRAYIDEGVSISFSLPDEDALPTEPTVSVFLYEIHEDLQLRMGGSRMFDPQTSQLMPGYVNVCCSYLITYWDTGETVSPDGPSAAPDNQAITVMSQVVDALINNRQLADLPDAYTRMLPPQEGLNGLGNFWQSLGNKPRLSINCSVTVPITLTDRHDLATPVKTTEADVVQIATETPSS